jgi:hypothetical protein
VTLTKRFFSHNTKTHKQYLKIVMKFWQIPQKITETNINIIGEKQSREEQYKWQYKKRGIAFNGKNREF